MIFMIGRGKKVLMVSPIKWEVWEAHAAQDPSPV
jgi:hypothetical protein